MDTARFDRVTRTFSPLLSRRALPGALGVAALIIPRPAEATKRKKKKATFNAFGCVDVGRFCKNAGQCCSNICQGKKGKQTCRAHDTGECQPGQEGSPCTTSDDRGGACDVTTGNAGYCVGGTFGDVQQPFCARDLDCQTRIDDARAACLSDGHLCAVP